MKSSLFRSGSGKVLRSQRGVTLLEVMVAIGVAGVAIYALVTTMVNSGKQATSIASKADFNSLVNQFQGIFNNTSTCLAAFNGAGKTPVTAGGGSQPASTTNPVPATLLVGSTPLAAGAKTSVLNTALTITTLSFTGVTPGSGGSNYVVPLLLQVSRRQGNQTAVGGDTLSHTFNLIVTLAPGSDGNQYISSCAGQYTDYWVATGNTGQDIVYTGGNVGIGGVNVDPPAQKLDVDGAVQAAMFLYRSDARLKDNVREIPDALDRVLRLHGVIYDWKDRSIGKDRLGLLAQEVEKVFPEAVTTNPGTGLKSVSYGTLIAPVIEAFKEQGDLIQKQSQEIADLKRAVLEKK